MTVQTSLAIFFNERDLESVMSGSPDNVLKFEASLADLIRVVQKRVNRATDLIGSADDSEIIDREMRFIRPFWDFATARKSLNSARFWDKLQTELFLSAETPVRKTPLVWCPDRAATCLAARNITDRSQSLLIHLLFGVDLVIFNFTRLLGRMKNLFGLDDPESFEIRTTEAHSDHGFVFRNRCIVRQSTNGETYRIVTSLFTQPDGESIKIEKDYSRSLTDPQIELRLQTFARSTEVRQPILQYVGRHAEMKSRSGQVRVR